MTFSINRSVGAVLGAAAAVCLLMTASARAGQSGAAASSLSATSLVFAGELVGTPSAPQTVTLTNTGGAVLNIVTISVVGSAFSETNSCGNSVNAGATCAINITFNPLSFGTQTGTLVITSSAADSPQSIRLSGLGMGPALSASAATVSFPSQLVSTSSAAQTVTLSSSGDEPLTIYNIALSGPFSETDTCLASVLDAGTACTISVYYTPVAGGTATGKISITDNAYPALETIALTGMGADFSISLSPASNSTSAGQSAGFTVSVAPTGGFTGDVTLGCGGLPTATACSFAPGTVTVSGSAAVTSALTVSTNATSAVPAGAARRPPGALPASWICMLTLGLAGAAIFCRRRKRLMLACVLAAALLPAALAMPACGSGTTAPATTIAPGTYGILVTGTAPAGTGSLQNTAVLTLIVN